MALSAKFLAPSWQKIAYANLLHMPTMKSMDFVLRCSKFAIFANGFVLVESTNLGRNAMNLAESFSRKQNLCGLLLRGAKEFIPPPPPARARQLQFPQPHSADYGWFTSHGFAWRY
jgi:hypothetical protein